jgi:hypothetical protein
VGLDRVLLDLRAGTGARVARIIVYDGPEEIEEFEPDDPSDFECFFPEVYDLPFDYVLEEGLGVSVEVEFFGGDPEQRWIWLRGAGAELMRLDDVPAAEITLEQWVHAYSLETGWPDWVHSIVRDAGKTTITGVGERQRVYFPVPTYSLLDGESLKPEQITLHWRGDGARLTNISVYHGLHGIKSIAVPPEDQSGGDPITFELYGGMPVIRSAMQIQAEVTFDTDDGAIEFYGAGVGFK